MPDPVEPRPSGGLSGALSQLATSIVAMVHTRFELLTVEFEEERERTKELLVLIVMATVFLSFALVVFSVLIVVLFWHTYPVTAIVCVLLVYAAIGGGALFAVRRRRHVRPFGATLSELEKDVQWFRRGR
jgi:uncharacterized membrane protein YqjE